MMESDTTTSWTRHGRDGEQPGGRRGGRATTALVVAGPSEWQAVAHDVGIAQAMLIDGLGRIHLTEALRPRLRFTIDPERGIPMDAKP